MEGEKNPVREAFVAPPPDPSVPAPRRGGLGYRAVKRAFDIVFSGVVCLVGLVPGALLCLAIRLDSPGAPIFSQERVGLNGRLIRIYKFRTMVADAHEHPERYMTPDQLEVWHREQKLDDDPRVTRMGRLLRRTSLDELPQFLNVLRGGSLRYRTQARDRGRDVRVRRRRRRVPLRKTRHHRLMAGHGSK